MFEALSGPLDDYNNMEMLLVLKINKYFYKENKSMYPA